MWVINLFVGILLLGCILYGVWKWLRAIYIKKIFDRIETADNHTLAITMNLIRVSSNDYGAKTIRYEEIYKVRKELYEYLRDSKCWIQKYLMTTQEKQRYERVFKDFVNAEKEFVGYSLFEYSDRNKIDDLTNSEWFIKWYNSTR